MPLEKLIVGAREVADWIGASDRTVRELADKGIAVRVGRGKYDLRETIRNYSAHMREVSAGRGGETQILDLTEQRARLAKEQADGQEIKNAQLRGELVSAVEVARQWEDMIRTAAAAMLAVPSRCADRLSLERFQTEVIDREIREALEALSNDATTEDTSEGDEGMAPAAEDDPIDMG